jgi:hypothetical protein
MSVAELARLVSRAQRGERGAFDQLVQRFEAKVYRAWATPPMRAK